MPAEISLDCSQLIVGITSVDKFPDLDSFDRGEIVSARRMGYSISEIVRQLGFSRSTVAIVYQEHMDGGQKTSDRANCEGQLAFTVRPERRLRRIVRSQRSQTLAQITTQMNEGANGIVGERTVQRSLHRMGFGSRRLTRVPFSMLAIKLHVLPVQESTENGM
ncbi:uncharacterized protein TNCV_4276931 [Trichonephila clavipes]|nr:uncharacterized protein TNCV_4276931 [Trichonephila clavipes]